ncbi:DUF5753 domain-containing protein [Saccharothrix violaceirubra]|uniref:DUF5753 domain-containing protein n=1 Tax=Saccharothrix violaceirubra TaxID=413306 RepID=A0A7W7WV40_9PSEU|nr:DUF5753 domain-containing protein [Saccharothrix violaceirubra]MBB4964532.1 hypothetical protein [Saccharothrix violaceirubra]
MLDDDDPGPIVQRLIFGAEMAELRGKAGFSVDEANVTIGERLAVNPAAKRGWYRGKLGKIENGDLNISDVELDVAFALYGVGGSKASEIRTLAVEARRRQTPIRVPDHGRKYIWLERAADEIRQFFAITVPGNLQTAEYALMQMSTSLVMAPVDLPEMAAGRVARGDRFAADEKRVLHTVIGEAALRTPIMNPGVMRGQLDRLLALAERPNITIQVVPMEVGLQASLEHSYSLLHIARARTTIVYVESLTTADYLPRPPHTTTYGLAFEKAQSLALGPAASVDLIRSISGDL